MPGPKTLVLKRVHALYNATYLLFFEVPPVSTTSMVNIMPTEGPFGLKIIQNGSTWKDLKSFTAGSEISRLGLRLLNQCNHAVKDKSTYEV